MSRNRPSEFDPVPGFQPEKNARLNLVTTSAQVPRYIHAIRYPDGWLSRVAPRSILLSSLYLGCFTPRKK